MGLTETDDTPAVLFFIGSQKGNRLCHTPEAESLVFYPCLLLTNLHVNNIAQDNLY